MLMDVIFFIMFLMVNMLVVGVSGYVYSGKEEYQDGMSGIQKRLG